MDRLFSPLRGLRLLISFLVLLVAVGCDEDEADHSYVVESYGVLLSDSVTTDSVTRYMVKAQPMFRIQPSIDFSLQGIAVYNNKLFQCYDKNQQIDVYDLATQQLAYTIAGDMANSTHCNNVDFSNIYYAPEDEFPLLYLEVRGNQRRTLVYRIVRQDADYVLQKIQTIKFTNCTGCTTTLDNSDSTLVVYHDKDGGQVYSKVKVPDLSRSTVTIPLDSTRVMASMAVASTRVGQDATIKDGKMYHLFGYADDCELIITSLGIGKEVARINLPRTGFWGEPEGIAFAGDTMIVTNIYGVAFHLSFTKQILT